MHDEIKSKLQANIWKLYIIKGLNWFLLVMPIIVLFFQENGLSMKEVLLLQSIFSIGIILFEIPSGYFSDVLGRRNSILVGCILGFIGVGVYSISFGFWGFLIAELILGLGSSFISGTDSALTYDSLTQLKREKQYKKIEGRMLSIGNFSEAIASIFGGFAALISLRTPFFIETALMFFTIPLAMSLFEPSREKYKAEENPLKEIIKIVKYSLHHHAEIKWLIFYASFVGASTLTLVWFIQPYFKFVGLPLAYFGFVWAALNLSVGIFSLQAHKYEALLGRKKSLVSLIFLIFVGYLLLSIFSSLWAIGFIFIFYFIRGISEPVLKDYINKIITSNMRASVLSVKNMVGRIIFAIVGPLIGWINDVYTLQTALLISGGIFVVFGIITLLFLHKNKTL